MEQNKSLLVERMKFTLSAMVRSEEVMLKRKTSDYISAKFQRKYAGLAALFSAATGDTIEQFVIARKIERAQEMLASTKLTLTQIAFQLRYSSVGHLSNQFKKVTGLTPTCFRLLKHRSSIREFSILNNN